MIKQLLQYIKKKKFSSKKWRLFVPLREASFETASIPVSLIIIQNKKMKKSVYTAE